MKMADCGNRATQARRCIHSTVGSVRIWCHQLEKIAFSVFVIRTNADDSSLFASAAIGKMIGGNACVFAQKSMVCKK
ncbi:hypothetical protein LL972_17695 [Xanthomonas campestris pv. asclepiadis]|uniref:hypothetical protein n=1 Tax=Xanthomonas campestris TaxID=339 RepID=UPI001E57191F|nr:hypothetical protein [Xanthomonas campestris]MCC4617808.1 hypothetical protein [Xanthomonas campestris pv. asclepiadis]